jgi:predicted nucleotide-binding protein (sugar kinase/HSP70/actin superfamily)
MGNYYVAFKPIAELFSDEVLIAPPITKRTIELGVKHSPEWVCIPFKYNLGNYIEALDMGANVLVQAGGGCRFGYYGEVQEEILRKLGYEFEFVKFVNTHHAFELIQNFKRLDPRVSYLRIVRTYVLCYARLHALDRFENALRLIVGFQEKPGTLERLHKRFLKDLEQAYTRKEVKRVEAEYTQAMAEVPLNKPENPIRVAVVGELYVLMEPFSNFGIEKELAKRGVEVHRFVTVSSILHEAMNYRKHVGHFIKKAAPYVTNHLGAHGTESVARVLELIKEGFDGMIHVKPFGCMPEVNAMPALHRISKDFKVPIIYFSFDSQTSQTGIQTRLEAFYDMLVMKKNIYAKNTTPQTDQSVSRG